MKFSITNLLLLITIAGLIVSLSLVLLAKDPVVTVSSSDNTYSFEFRQHALKASPNWPESEKNPPLAVRDAIQIADQICASLNSANRNKWKFDSLCLSHLNSGFRDLRTRNSSTKWCYIVHFRPTNAYRQTELVTFMILMDGTVLVGEGGWSNSGLEKKMRRKYAKDAG